ncbi:MAG: hypothetical protein WCS15_03370 [Prevotella sp.]|nr:hypothetical protein [Prevotella sp.]MDD3388196.1 hypothetical protein [Prevotella sp.]MDD4533555.1 hypothetical protein [Prevotella sp.]
MHRDQDPAWGLLEPVDYTSKTGNVLTGFALFARPLLRTRHWEADYILSAGIGYIYRQQGIYIKHCPWSYGLSANTVSTITICSLICHMDGIYI